MKYFAIFNMADVFISAAVVVFVLLILRGVNIDGSRTRAGTPSDTDGSSESE